MRCVPPARYLAVAVLAGGLAVQSAAQEAKAPGDDAGAGANGTAGQGATVPGVPTTVAPLTDGAEGQSPGGSVTIPSPVLTLDPDRLFSDSEYGKRVETEIEARARALAAENRQIETKLSTEEKELNTQRPTLAPEEFRKLADAFDAKVQRIRKAQDAKKQALNTVRDTERQKFLQLVLPILGGLIRESGAVAILNRQAIFLSFKGIDVTDRAIARINDKIGDGAALDRTAPEPKAAPAPDQTAPTAGDGQQPAPGQGG